MKVYNKIRSIFIFIMLMEVALGCSSKRNTYATRAYHELTTRYNIYHNAHKTYDQLLEDQLTTGSINWFEPLSIHQNKIIANKTTPGGLFDGVIDKTTQAIIEHSISSKPQRDPSKAQSAEYRRWLRQEEFNPFIKNTWLLLGKAYVENGDYKEALSVFAEIQRIYPYDIDLISETQLYMLRSYVALKNMYDAKNIIYILQSRNLIPTLTQLYNQEYANYLIYNKEFNKAIPYLIKTIKNEKIFLQKKRLQFLLGQIYLSTGDNENAYNIFKKIKSLKTPPLLNQNASIYQAVISNNSKQNKFYNDSLAQIINHNNQLTDNNNHHTLNDSTNIYTTQSIVRVKTYTPIDKPDTNKLKTSKLLDMLMDELNQQKSETEISEKIVPLSSSISKTISVEPEIRVEPEANDSRITPAELIKRLEQNEAESIRRSQQTARGNNRQQQLKNREKQREAKLKERDKEIKERERNREAQLRQREKERQNKIRKQK